MLCIQEELFNTIWSGQTQASQLYLSTWEGNGATYLEKHSLTHEGQESGQE